MSDCMTFPDTVEEFMEQYEIVDTEHVYTNGVEMVPIFRMKQWFEHLPECEDAVSRKWLLEAVEEGWIKFDTEEDYNRYIHLVRDIAPSVTPKRKTGKWIGVSPMTDTLMCSECGYNILGEEFKSNFCPDCGSYNGGDDNGNE